MVLFCAAYLRGLHIFLEQPISSLAPHYDVLDCFISFALGNCVTSYLGTLGGPTCKAIHIWSDAPEVVALRCERKLTDAKLTVKNFKGVHGKREALHRVDEPGWDKESIVELKKRIFLEGIPHTDEQNKTEGESENHNTLEHKVFAAEYEGDAPNNAEVVF